MDTILASSKEDNNEQMIIQQHDTVVNDCVKKDICSVSCSVSAPSNEDQPSINPGQPDTALTSEVEPMQTDITTEVTETTQEVIGKEQNPTSMVIESGDQAPVQATLTAQAIDQTESNIDAAIATSIDISENAQTGYESSDLESSDDEDQDTGKAVTAQPEGSDSDR